MRVIRFVLAVAVVALVAAGGGYVYVESRFDVPTDPDRTEAVIVEVPKGATFRAMGRVLQENGLITTTTWWRIYPRLHPDAAGLKAGRHRIEANQSIRQIVQTLSENPLPEDVPLTLVEGWRLTDTDEALAKQGVIEPGAYLSAARRPDTFNVPFDLEGARDLEGYLLPETYAVPPGTLDVHTLIQRQLDAFFSRFVAPNREKLARSGRTLRATVIMASLLEREEPKPEIRPKVAGVLFKRLDAGTPLGVDATSRFTLKSWNNRRAFLKKLRDPRDPYNTRLRRGLPPGPIGAPSLASLNAALEPQRSRYWYYLHDAQQRIHFARTAKEHEANRRRYNVW